MPRVVHTRPAGHNAFQGDLFSGLKFFIAQRVPFRTSYVQKVTSNGGDVVKLEQHATILIGDHLKPNDAPPGSISYRFIDKALDSRTLPDPDDDEFRCGAPKGEVRPVGDSRPTKTLRMPFTTEDDRELYKWVKNHEINGGAVRGNEIYKQLEAVNNRHTFQSWRDRYLKKLQHDPPPDVVATPVPANAPPAPPVEQTSVQNAPKGTKNEQRKAAGPKPPAASQVSPRPFKAADIRDLVGNGHHILNTTLREEDRAWADWAKLIPCLHTPEEWKTFWKTAVLPIYLDQEDNKKRLKIYNHSWDTWFETHKDASADEWLSFYVRTVKPRFEFEDENSQNIATPSKGKNRKRFCRAAEQSFSGSTSQKSGTPRVKRAREEDPDEDLYDAPSPSKRIRRESESAEDGPIEVFEDVEDNAKEVENEDSLADEDDETGQQEHEYENVQADPPHKQEPEEEDADSTQGAINTGEQFVSAQGDDYEEGFATPPSPSPEEAKSTSRRLQDIALDTQAIVDAESQSVDFDVPPPDGGFGDEEDEHEEFEDAKAIQSVSSDPLGSELAAEATPFESIEVDETAIDPALRNLEDNNESPAEVQPDLESQLSEPEEHRSLEDRIAAIGVRKLVAAGHDPRNLATAVKMTSGHPTLFRLVLGAIVSGEGIPKDVPGIWTEQEDAALEGGDARAIEALHRHHGWDGVKGCAERLEFLRVWRK